MDTARQKNRDPAQSRIAVVKKLEYVRHCDNRRSPYSITLDEDIVCRSNPGSFRRWAVSVPSSPSRTWAKQHAEEEILQKIDWSIPWGEWIGIIDPH